MKQVLLAFSFAVVAPAMAQSVGGGALDYCENIAVLMQAIDQESIRCDPSDSPSYKFAASYQSKDANFYQMAIRYRSLCAAGIRGSELYEHSRHLCLDGLKGEGRG